LNPQCISLQLGLVPVDLASEHVAASLHFSHRGKGGGSVARDACGITNVASDIERLPRLTTSWTSPAVALQWSYATFISQI
jgi:hypothetical protein